MEKMTENANISACDLPADEYVVGKDTVRYILTMGF